MMSRSFSTHPLYEALSDGVYYPAQSYKQTSPCSKTETWPAFQAVCPTNDSVVSFIDEETTEGRVAPTDGNWSEVVRSGKVKMTEMSAYRTHVIRQPVRVPQMGVTALRGGSVCISTCQYTWGPYESVALWYNLYTINAPTGGDFAEAIATHREKVDNTIITNRQTLYRNLNEGYDLASEIGELPETIRWLSSLIDKLLDVLEKFVGETNSSSRRQWRVPKNPKQAVQMGSKYAGELLDRWMEYRYAVMPIVYSIKDVAEVLRYADRIVRKGSNPENVHSTFNFVSDNSAGHPNLDGIPLRYSVVVDTDVVSSGRILYDLGSSQRLLDQVSTNLFLTGWELLTLSFVLDWVWNISDSIFAVTNVPVSSSSKYCTAVKERVSISIETTGEKFMSSTKLWSASTCQGPAFSVTTERTVPYPSVVAFQQNTQSYVRSVWDRPPGTIIFNPFLDWKRKLDLVALIHKPVHKRITRL
jgi:hypothetical protein